MFETEGERGNYTVFDFSTKRICVVLPQISGTDNVVPSAVFSSEWRVQVVFRAARKN